MNNLRRLASLVVAVLLVCLFPAAAFADEATVKASLTVTSGESSASVTVTDDYRVAVTLPEGTVDMASVTGTILLNDVSGLGVTGQRQHTVTLNTGMTGTVDPRQFFTNLYAFSGASANVTVDYENEVSYAFTGNGSSITGTPDTVEAARAAWLALIGHVTTTVKADNDSYAILANGSYVKVGTEYLHFDDSYSGDLRLDNVGSVSAFKAAIREALVLETDYENQGNVATVFLKKGTALALGTSLATLKHDYVIEVTVGDAVKDVISSAVLEGFRACSGGSEMLSNAIALADRLVGAVETDGSVDISLHPADLARYSVSLVLEDEISVNFYVQDIAPVAELSKFEVKYSFKGEDAQTGTLSSTKSNKFVVARCAAKEMGDTVKIEVFYDNVLIKDIEYSVRQYCEDKLEDPKSGEKTKALCLAVLEYGAKSQTYFNYETDAPVNANHFSEDISETTVPDDYAAVSEGTCTGLRKSTVSLSLEAKTELNFYFLLKSGYAAEGFTFTCDGAPVTPVENEDGVLCLKIEGIAAKDLGNTLTIVVTNNDDGTAKTILYSPLSWAHSKQSSGAEATQLLAKALYNYYAAAYAYKH